MAAISSHGMLHVVSAALMICEPRWYAESAADGMPLVEMLATVKLVASRSEATRLVKSGGVYVNNVRATDERARLRRSDAIGGQVILLRKGRKDQHVVKVRQS